MAREGITGSGVLPSRNIFWFGEQSLKDSDNLSDPGNLTQEIVDDFDAALEQFREITIDPGGDEPIENGGGTEGGQDPAPESVLGVRSCACLTTSIASPRRKTSELLCGQRSMTVDLACRE